MISEYFIILIGLCYECVLINVIPSSFTTTTTTTLIQLLISKP